MKRFLEHLAFIVRMLAYAILVMIVLSVILFPWLRAGHASPVVFLVPGLFVAHLVAGPGLLDPTLTRISAIGISGGVFFMSAGLCVLLVTTRSSEIVWLALPFVHLLTSSLLLEAVYRLRRGHSPAAKGAASR